MAGALWDARMALSSAKVQTEVADITCRSAVYREHNTVSWGIPNLMGQKAICKS